MKQILLLGIFTLLLSSSTIVAQQSTDSNTFKTIDCNLPVDSAFDNIIDYLQDNEYFIVSMDKTAGFIQAKNYIKKKNILSSVVGERQYFNFIIRPSKEKQSSITLNIYSEELIYNEDYFYLDKGIIKDKTIYVAFLDALQVFLDRK